MDFSQIKILIFDADDTLWENNIYYIRAAEDLVDLISEVGVSRTVIERQFQEIERSIVRDKGYGSKNYIHILQLLYNHYAEMLPNSKYKKRFDQLCLDFEKHIKVPPILFPGVLPILNDLSKIYKLYVLTKGNIEEQKKKRHRSNLLQYFLGAFVETEKNIQTYERILDENQWHVDEICMIGNSPKSDINPALKLGMYAVFIPYEHTWVLDDEPLIKNQHRLQIIHSFSDLKKLEFYDVDLEKFGSIKMAYYVLENQKNAGAVFNAANETAVEHFLRGEITFIDIFTVVGSILYKEKFQTINSVEDIVETIERTKDNTENYIKRRKNK